MRSGTAREISHLTITMQKESMAELSDQSDYHSVKKLQLEMVKEVKSNPNRFQKISEREDRCDMNTEAMKIRCKGKYCCTHKGCPILKWPEDVMTLQQLFWDVRPAAIVELGSFNGGSAIWMADVLRMLEVECVIYSMDIDTTLISDTAKALQPNNVTFMQGDNNNLQKTFSDEFLQSLPHPLIVIEDAHINLYGILEFFHPHMKTGDYYIVEDLCPDAPNSTGYGLVPAIPYNPVGTTDLESVKKFLSDYNDHYSVDSFYTDLFGYNGVWNWHGFIRKM